MQRLLATLTLLAGLPLAAQGSPDRALLRSWLAGSASPPAAELPARLVELTALLDSPDPELRDDLAFGLFAKWLVRDRIVPLAARRQLLVSWSAKLRVVPDAGPDAVLGRSFAALCLSLLVALDNQEPWLQPAEFDGLFAAAIGYLRAETDVRGFDAKLGWIHAVAHTADLLKFLARSPHLTPVAQGALLGALADKLAATPVPLVAGEDERLARAVLSLAARPDFDAEAFAAWLPVAWPRPGGGPPTPASLAREHNARHLITSLQVLLAVDGRASLQAARDAVASHLRARFR